MASAARIYPFGDERTSTFWLVMVPVLMAIAVAAGIWVVTASMPGNWARWAAAAAFTAAALAVWVPAKAPQVQAKALNPQNPLAQIHYVEAHFRPGDVILVNSEASFAFAYYYQKPTDDYQAVTSAANGFVPQYPGIPWKIGRASCRERVST